LEEKLDWKDWKFEAKDKDTIKNQANKLKGLNSNEIKEMFEDADSDKDKLIDFDEFINSLKNIEIIPIKPVDNS